MLTTLATLTYVFFFNDTATTEIYTLSLHDALPIYVPGHLRGAGPLRPGRGCRRSPRARVPRSRPRAHRRSEEHTSELQSRPHLVCRLLLETKTVYTRHAGTHRRNEDHG